MGSGTTVVQMSESVAAEKEKREITGLHAWLVLVGVVALFAANYYYRAELFRVLSVVIIGVATLRSWAGTRTALFTIGGVALVALGIYMRSEGVGTVVPYIPMLLGVRSWSQGVCEAFAKGFIPPRDPHLP